MQEMCRVVQGGGGRGDGRVVHERMRKGSERLSKTCGVCGLVRDTKQERVTHEAACKKRKEAREAAAAGLPPPQKAIVWECVCTYKVLEGCSSMWTLRRQHEKKCRGSWEANVTCRHCGVAKPSVLSRMGHETSCPQR